MKILFCHDGPVIKHQNKYYSQLLNDQLFSRYIEPGDLLTVAVRTREMTPEEQEKQIDKISGHIRVVECPNLSSLEGILLNQKKAEKILTPLVKEADVIYIRVPGLLSSKCIDIAEKLHKPYLLEVVGCPWDAFWNHSLKGKFIAPFYMARMKRQLKRAPYALYVTRQFLQKRYPTKGKTLGCSDVMLQPVDASLLEKRLTKIRENNGKIVLGTAAGVHVRYKGQQYVILALGILKELGYTHFEYSLAGEGSQDYLRSVAEACGVSEQVHFMGNLPKDKVFDWLDGLDVYIQPSRSEGLPRALAEAMSRALPAIGAQAGGIPELLEPSVVFRHSKHSERAICELLLSLNTETMCHQAQHNFLKAKEYDCEKLTEQRNQFYTDFRAYCAEQK
ncbi:MAG: glycosyltransferase [Ruminococcaceae bacterium]|nr:glycosyltransferase [Oscillospiraceae bacterium]